MSYSWSTLSNLTTNCSNQARTIEVDNELPIMHRKPNNHYSGSSTINWQSIVGLKVYDTQDDIVASGTMTARSQNEISVKLSSVNNIYKFVFTFENTLPAGLAHIIQLHYGS